MAQSIRTYTWSSIPKRGWYTLTALWKNWNDKYIPPWYLIFFFFFVSTTNCHLHIYLFLRNVFDSMNISLKNYTQKPNRNLLPINIFIANSWWNSNDKLFSDDAIKMSKGHALKIDSLQISIVTERVIRIKFIHFKLKSISSSIRLFG